MRNLRKLVISLTAIFIFVLFNIQPVQANITVAPRRFIFRIDERNTQVVEVTNKSEHRMRIRVYPAKPEEMEEGFYLGEWLVLYPPVLQLEPGQKRAVRFSVRTPKDLADGEYRSLLFFEELPRKNSSSEEGINFSLLTRLGINIYGQYGELDYSGKLEDKNIENIENGIRVSGNFINQGNAHLRMDVEAQLIKRVKKEDKIKKEVVDRKELSSFVVHRAAVKKFEREINLPVDQGEELKIIFRQKKKEVYQFSHDI